jgi:hypothetical protein
MMNRFYGPMAIAFFWLGVVFAFFESIYGYFFGVWNEVLDKLSNPQSHVAVTKFGETMLFGFLALACLLVSIGASLRQPR